MIWVVLVLGSVASGWLLGRGSLAANLRAAAGGLPEHLLTLLLGVTTGLYQRERIRRRRTYASPTLAYLGKGLLFAALSGTAAGVLSPVAWPESTLGLLALGAATGLSIWLGNLPSRL